MDVDRRFGLILGIESSCDETAAAVVRAGGEVLANVVASQMKLHANYGGVVPELASREHLRNIVPVVRAAMAEAARVSPGLTFEDLDAIAVTEGPGLAGALLVGITYAKALALGLGKPLVAVNHLEGHIHAVLMEARVRHEAMEMALVVSGGHTHLYLAKLGAAEEGNPPFPIKLERMGHPASSEYPTFSEGVWRFRNVGRTVDDAAGEAFDKVAKLLGLGYPGGPWMDALAAHGNPRAVEFRFQQIKPRGKHAEGDSPCAQHFDFSFSGIKTAVLRYIQAHGMGASIEARRKALAEIPNAKASDAVGLCDAQTLDLIASFQYAVVGNLMRQAFAAAEAFGVRGIVVSGGVSANSELRRRFTEEAGRRGLTVAFPTLAMSTDNAAMIAAAAWPKFCAGELAAEGLVATPQLRLG
jgi:N6-L-threonylcarbamoyladenine synthase